MQLTRFTDIGLRVVMRLVAAEAAARETASGPTTLTTKDLAAELAVNSWSDLLTVTPLDFGDELVDLAPGRIYPVDSVTDPGLADPVESDGDDVLDGRLRAGAGDGWMPQVVLKPHLSDQSGELAEAVAALRTRERRAAVALVLGAETEQVSDEWLLTLTDDGSLVVPALGLRLSAPQLTVQQALDIATLLAFERDSEDAPIPAADGNRPWQLHTDAAGALHDGLIGPDTAAPPTSAPSPRLRRGLLTEAVRDSAGPTPTGRPTGARTSSTTSGASDVPGSATPADVRREVEDDLAQLDRDLADWWSPDSARPRLTLLGPVALRAHGDEEAVARSGLRRRYEETVAYLATRPHGATADEAATALQPARGGRTDPVSARAYVHRVAAGARAWLGIDPATGQHVAAAVRGDGGMSDLLAALRLVSGPPFAQRPAGYEWLDGLDLTLTAAVCDVAHKVVSTALADGDLAAASTASATALLVAPDDEQVLLDAMWVAFHQGHRAEAETYVGRIVAVHDGEDEMDLPMSTAETINRARRQFLDRAS